MSTRLVSLKRPMNVFDDTRDHELERLGQDDEPHLLRIGEPQRICRLVLAARDRLQPAADGLGEIGG